MYLTKAKICGHQIIKNSSWFQFSRHLTFLAGPCGSGKTSLLRILQTINPHPLQNFDNPFATFPDHFLTKGYKRIVDPRKKTAALAIFKSNDEMRNQLAEIERSLINTDKIEVGRRLDWSRWLSFVEISSSTRWSEIEDKVAALTHHIADQSILSGLKTEFPELSQLTATDRVKGEAMHLLGNWLTAIKPHLAEKENDLFNSTLHSVYRYQRMRAAKKVVSSQLPSFLYLRSNLLLNTPLSLSRLLAQQQQPSPILEEFSANFLAHHLFSHTPSIDPKRISHFLDRLADRVEILSHSADRLTHTLDGDTLTLYQKRPTGQQLPLSEAGGYWKWLVTICLLLHPSPQNTNTATILLLDEPEKGLNHASHREFNSLIRRLSQQVSVLWATESLKTLQAAEPNSIRLLIPGPPDTGSTIRSLSKSTELDELFG